MFKENIFNIDGYYPTPKKLINKILEGLDFRTNIHTVLEPSAGDGNIAEVVLERMKSVRYNSYSRNEKKYDIDCIEINSELSYILKGKGFRVVHDDFLTYDTYKKYDLIIMNPDFEQGDKHLLKALSLIEHGGTVICILNANTIKNPYSNTRKDLVRKLNDYNASVEYLQEEFTQAERRTNVEIAVVRVTIENKNRESIILNKLKQEEQFKQQNGNNNKLIEGDFINGIIQQYNFEIKAGVNLINEYNNLQPLTLKSFKKDNYTSNILNLSIDGSKYDKSIGNDNLVNAYIKKVRYKYWEALFNNEQFTSLLTTNLLYEYRQKITDMQDYDFSYYNIKEIQKQMNINMIKSVEDTILNLFEEFSHKYHWHDETSKNIRYFNGWKTNSSYKINKRVITVLSAYSSITGRLDYTYKFYEKLKDIEHVFNYLDGGKTEESDLKEILNKAQNERKTKNIITKYFSINTFKKGTTHLTFLDEELLQKFNIFGSMKKNWLPNGFGKCNYNDMTEEEKKVVNEFCGKDEYNKIVKDKDYYLYNPSKILMLT
jgi:hypothetical protein